MHDPPISTPTPGMQDGTPNCDAESLMMISNSDAYFAGYSIYIMDISELWAYACDEVVSIYRKASIGRKTYHGLYIRMRNGIKLVEFELVLRSNVDICTFILGTIAVLWC